jgi:hypothetical protein
MRRKAKAVWCLAAVVLFSGSLVSVRGDEPKSACPEQGVPVLGKIPYISRLFKNVGVAHEPGCAAGQCQKTPCADEFERIGVDFGDGSDWPEGHVWRFGWIGLADGLEGEPGKCAGVECQACPALAIGKVAACCPAGCCESKCCAEQCAAKQATACKCAEHQTACKCADRDELLEQIMELTAEKAAAQGALEAHEAVHEILGEMAELAAKNAALEAKLEAQAEGGKLVERMAELAAENARLKSQVELAEVKVALMKQTIGVEVEKQMLAHRVAELEARLAAGETTTRTARKAEGKKAR